MVQEAQRVFMLGPTITFRRARKLSSYLVRSKLYQLEWTVGFCKCFGKRWEVCDNVTETSIFTSTVTQNIYKLNYQFNCSEKCFIYLRTCNKCLKQCVKQTLDKVRRRWNNYKSNDRKDLNLACKNIFLVIFQWHAMENFIITFIDKADPFDPLQRN